VHHARRGEKILEVAPVVFMVGMEEGMGRQRKAARISAYQRK